MYLEKISTKAPRALMNTLVAGNFESLRREVREKSGVDFLDECGDVFREATLRTNKVGVAYRSNHKTGRAFDYDQANPALLIVKENIAGKTYFRTYLKCTPQNGTRGFKTTIRDRRGFSYTGYVLDFTAMAERHGFTRIPAWKGWENSYNKQEFWHYEKMDGLTWDEAMKQIASKPVTMPRKVSEKIYGYNDRGPEVTAIQQKLSDKGYLPREEVDGIYGKFTTAAVRVFQKRNGLDVDGLVGPNTRKELFK